MNLKNGSVYDKSLPSDEVRVLVMRHWPRGIKSSQVDLWIPAAAPSAALLKRYRNQEITWENFAQAYKREQIEAKGGRAYLYIPGIDGIITKGSTDFTERPIDLIAKHANSVQQTTGRTLRLLCWEREGHNCHRHLLQEMMEQSEVLLS